MCKESIFVVFQVLGAQVWSPHVVQVGLTERSVLLFFLLLSVCVCCEFCFHCMGWYFFPWFLPGLGICLHLNHSYLIPIAAARLTYTQGAHWSDAPVAAILISDASVAAVLMCTFVATAAQLNLLLILLINLLCCCSCCLMLHMLLHLPREPVDCTSWWTIEWVATDFILPKLCQQFSTIFPYND